MQAGFTGGARGGKSAANPMPPVCNSSAARIKSHEPRVGKSGVFFRSRSFLTSFSFSLLLLLGEGLEEEEGEEVEGEGQDWVICCQQGG